MNLINLNHVPCSGENPDIYPLATLDECHRPGDAAHQPGIRFVEDIRRTDADGGGHEVNVLDRGVLGGWSPYVYQLRQRIGHRARTLKSSDVIPHEDQRRPAPIRQ